MPPANPAFGLLSCPLSPQPPSPVGKGETISLFRRGLRPRHPCIKPFAALTVFAMRAPGGGLAFLLACLPRLWLAFLPPIPRPALAERSSPVGKGENQSFLMQGASPLASPRLSRRRHWHNYRHQVFSLYKRRNLSIYEQCRQPRRGGTGGDGTIRRKRRRRLRWSSPPGQGNQVPQGEQPPPLPPPGTCLAGSVSAASG